jgi:hypothetical protein
MRGMYRTAIVPVIAALIALGTSAAYGAEVKEAPKAPKGYVMVPEEALRALFGNANRHMQIAVDDFGRGDNKDAATELRVAAAYVKIEAARAAGDERKKLDEIVVRLDKAAVDLEKGNVKDVATLKNLFAWADYLLSKHHIAMAKEAAAEERQDAAAYDLKSAIHYLEEGLSWTGRTIDAGTAAVIKDGKALVEKVGKGTKATNGEFASLIDRLGKEVDAFGSTMR